MRTKYVTYAEASEAAQRLGFKTKAEYQNGCKQDPKLPFSPNQVYAEDWGGWYVFLGTKRPEEKYATYAEAAEAAQRLGFKTMAEFQKGYKRDPKFPFHPERFYGGGWDDWCVFLGTKRAEEKYATYAEASEAAQRLGFQTMTEYKRGYKQDPKLPIKPNQVYAEHWDDWYVFLGTERPGEEKYATYVEASQAAQRLGLKTQAEYKKGYKQDPNLPFSPDHVYAEHWDDWYNFLGTERPREKYATYVEASQTAQRLGLKTQAEYQNGYKQDPRLPSNPEGFYADGWDDWYDFLGTERPGENKYATYAEASEAAQRLKFKTLAEYKKGYQQDPKLPSNPNQFYAKHWISWPRFLGNGSVFDPELLSEYPKFWESIQSYVEAGTNQNSKYSHLKAFLKDYVAELDLVDDPGALLSRDISFNERIYEAFVHATGESQKKPRHNVCSAFFEWILETYCSDEDDEGELIVLPGYRNPLRTVLKGLLDQLPSPRRSESSKPPLPMDAILRAKQHLIPPEATSFRDLYRLHSFLEDCWFEVDPQLIDDSDPDCIYRVVTKDRKRDGERYFEEAYELWSPVKIVANYTLLSMPLRGQQICWLDSGEGDEFVPICRDGKVHWIKNSSQLATRKRNQGFIRKGNDDDELSSYITTNKTGKKLGGYDIPFMPEDLAYWVIQLREWQSKYNPIEELTPWTQIKLRQRTNKDILKRRGKQAFLFRDPASNACDEKVSPIFTTTAFTRTLPALLFHSQRPGEDLAERIERPKGVDYKSQFTPHALRVSLITAYIVDGRAPIAVISKLVGHASLVMTIYYTKVGASKMRIEMAAAEKRALEQSHHRYEDLIIQKKIEEARPELIATDRSIMDQCLTPDWPSGAFQLMSIGICPMSGTKCDEGGEALVERKQEAFYSPVPSGYLGTRNCPQCRFFITGPAFLGGLSAIANEIILEINVTREEYHELEEKRQMLDDERYDTESSGQVFGKERTLKKITSAYEEKAKKLDMLLTDLQHLYRLISQSTELLINSETDQHQLIVSDNYVEMGMHLEEQSSEFRLLAEVCANAEIYESASASRARPLLSQMLDKLADTNGIAPAIFRLTEDQQLKAANQVVQLIMQVTQNNWHVADQLINGQITLEDLAEPLQLGDLRQEIESAMNGSLKFPLGIESCNE
ncbi:VPA1269 family protein [uncultured Marinobacter sp.]|uniref:gamma-mobile-trio integrase GmtZ n=1 Tax=uncultured Marinobacter sp. TaxID=187379 RepID=UPI002596386C|nr:VPA1269 family protein [uncultured Marinobacter sp.]|tara:strand:- start:321 stop:3797 length:3477 start_codon:yes stop_codon:yes gene_type:complete